MKFGAPANSPLARVCGAATMTYHLVSGSVAIWAGWDVRRRIVKRKPRKHLLDTIPHATGILLSTIQGYRTSCRLLIFTVIFSEIHQPLTLMPRIRNPIHRIAVSRRSLGCSGDTYVTVLVVLIWFF
jgi:hypothetical protein